MKPEDYKIRDDKTVAMTKRYDALIYTILSQHLYQGKNCGNAIRRIDRLAVHSRSEGLSGNLSYVTVAGKKCRSLDAALGTQFFCKAGKRNRSRLYAKEVQELLSLPSPPPANVMHVLTGNDGKFGPPKIFRVYQSRTTVTRSQSQIESIADSILTTAILTEHFRNGTYGILVLSENPSKLESMSLALAGLPIAQKYLVASGIGPVASNIHIAIKQNWSRFND